MDEAGAGVQGCHGSNVFEARDSLSEFGACPHGSQVLEIMKPQSADGIPLIIEGSEIVEASAELLGDSANG